MRKHRQAVQIYRQTVTLIPNMDCSVQDKACAAKLGLVAERAWAAYVLKDVSGATMHHAYLMAGLFMGTCTIQFWCRRLQGLQCLLAELLNLRMHLAACSPPTWLQGDIPAVWPLYRTQKVLRLFRCSGRWSQPAWGCRCCQREKKCRRWRSGLVAVQTRRNAPGRACCPAQAALRS